MASDEVHIKSADAQNVAANEHGVVIRKIGKSCHVNIEFSAAWKSKSGSVYRDVLGFEPRDVLKNRLCSDSM